MPFDLFPGQYDPTLRPETEEVVRRLDGEDVYGIGSMGDDSGKHCRLVVENSC